MSHMSDLNVVMTSVSCGLTMRVVLKKLPTYIYFVQMGRTAPLTHLGKVVLPTLLWAKLDSTPYGHNMTPDGSYIIKPVNKQLAALRQSHVMMDHYTYPNGHEVRAPAHSSCRRHGRSELLNMATRMYVWWSVTPSLTSLQVISKSTLLSTSMHRS
jgi:hypothetical protein